MISLLHSPLGLLIVFFQYSTQVQGFVFNSYRSKRQSINLFDKLPTVWSISSTSLISYQIDSIVENLIAEMVSPFIQFMLYYLKALIFI